MITPHSAGYHARQTFQLALPIVLSMAGQTFVWTADNIMVGHIVPETVGYSGQTALAASGFANSVFANVLVFGIGFSIALTQMTGAAYGAEKTDQLGSVFRHGLLLNMLLGIVFSLILILSEPLLYQMGQDRLVVEVAIPYYWLLNYSIFPFLVFFAFKQYAEGLSSTIPAMIWMLLSNLMNVLLNWILIYGHWGFEPMGLLGAGWATLISRIFLMVGFGAYVLRAAYFKPFLEGFWDWWQVSWSLLERVWRLGLPMGFQMFLEVGAFTTGSILVGLFGEAALSAQQIALNIGSITYLMASGVASAATIRVSQYFGRRDFTNLRISAMMPLWLVVGFMAGTGMIIFALRQQIPLWFVEDGGSAAVSLAAGLLVVVAFFQLFDGVQVIGMAVLRGVADTRIPTLIAIVAYWGLSLGGGVWMAFSLGLGPIGIWYGYLLGLAAAGLSFWLRYAWLLRGKLTQG